MPDLAPPIGPGPATVREHPGWVDPLQVLRAAATRRHAVLLYSGQAGRHPAARWSILAWDPEAVLTVRGRQAVLERAHGDTVRVEGIDPFDVVRRLTAPAPESAVRPAGLGGALPFIGGAIGVLGYGLRRAIERLTQAPADPLDQPDAWLAFHDRAVLFDHPARRIFVVASPCAARGAVGMERRCREAEAILAEAASLPGAGDVADEETPVHGSGGPAAIAEAATERDDYLRGVRAVLDRIARGDLYQANLSQRLSAALPETPVELFRRLMRRHPAPFAAYLDAGSHQIVSASPERFLALRGRRATTSPIKGTRPRGVTPREDDRLREALLLSRKDRAENIMIADLVRNDLGRVCEPGSVRVESLCALESYASVHHLVTTVAGLLRPDRDRVDLLRALFPAGSMTGAPKIRAMQVIAEIEREERGFYAGSLGYLSVDGQADLNIVIRTLVCQGGRAHFRVGGGIVADSTPEGEHQETLDKARGLLEVLGAGSPGFRS